MYCIMFILQSITSVLYAHSAIQTCITLLKVGRPAPHHEARQKRRELRQKQQADQEELELRMRELQTANENKQRELEAMSKVCNVLQQQLLNFTYLQTLLVEIWWFVTLFVIHFNIQNMAVIWLKKIIWDVTMSGNTDCWTCRKTGI